MSRFDLGDAKDYGDFLNIMAAAFGRVERWIEDRWHAASINDRWSPRAPLALRDLEILERPPVAPIEERFEPAGDGKPEILGALYVLEGSRLGSRVLRKRVAPGLPTHFLDDSEPPLAWRDLLRRIEGLSPMDLDRSSKAASAVFDIFLKAASR